MTEPKDEIARILNIFVSDLAEIKKEQKNHGERLVAIDKRLQEINDQPEYTLPPSPKEKDFDYRILRHSRLYKVLNSTGIRAKMESTRRCLALRDMPTVRTRYHTGAGDRKVIYKYRSLERKNGEEPPWISVEYQIDKGVGADHSAILQIPQPLEKGQVFEIYHDLELVNAFASRNEWVTLVVEYPTECFHLEVILPSERKLLGSRCEESEGASNTFNKRRVFPNKISNTGQYSLVWENDFPVTGRSYTLFWDW
jgi:hypothetical protein